jgi:hypothetical protein
LLNVRGFLVLAHLLSEFVENAGVGRTHDVMDLGYLVHLIGTREEWMQTGAQMNREDMPFNVCPAILID